MKLYLSGEVMVVEYNSGDVSGDFVAGDSFPFGGTLVEVGDGIRAP